MKYSFLLRNWFNAILLVLLVAVMVGCGGGGNTGGSAFTSTGGTTGGTTGGGTTGGGTTGGGTTGTATSLTLTWDAPTTNTDGTPISDLAGYKVYYGVVPGSYYAPIDAGSATSSVIQNLVPGTTYYFTVTAYDGSGNESAYATEVSKTL